MMARNSYYPKCSKPRYRAVANIIRSTMLTDSACAKDCIVLIGLCDFRDRHCDSSPSLRIGRTCAVPIHKLIANGSFGPDEIEVMKAAYDAALIDVGVTNPDDPITDLIA